VEERDWGRAGNKWRKGYFIAPTKYDHSNCFTQDIPSDEGLTRQCLCIVDLGFHKK
jgi:hypothetical protein